MEERSYRSSCPISIDVVIQRFKIISVVWLLRKASARMLRLPRCEPWIRKVLARRKTCQMAMAGWRAVLDSRAITSIDLNKNQGRPEVQDHVGWPSL